MRAIRMSYTNSMTGELTFQLDTQAAEEILTSMAAPIVKQSADAIASRAGSMYGSMTSQPVTVEVTERVGINTRGRGKRAIATVTAHGSNVRHDLLLEALVKSKDAGSI